MEKLACVKPRAEFTCHGAPGPEGMRGPVPLAFRKIFII